MTDRSGSDGSGAEVGAAADRSGADAADWRRLHPLSPLLRGGLAFVVILGIVIASLRDRVVELFFADPFVGGVGPDVDVEIDVSSPETEFIDYVFAEGLAILALLAVLAVLLLIVFFSWLSWRFRTFRVSGEAVEERSGIVFRQHRRAPLDRIQSVNLQRPLLARALGLTQVDVQTAGQGGRVSLRYLGQAQAKRVREQILNRVGEVRDAEDSPPAGGRAGLVAPLERRARDFVDPDIEADAARLGSLVGVPVSRLIGSILLGWELLIPALISVGVLVAALVWQPFLIALLIPSVIATFSIAFNQFNRGWGFVLSRSVDGIRVGAGLTSTNTETVPLGRIHAIEALQPILWRPFGWWKVRITTAGHSLAQGGQNKLQNSVLPVGLVEDVLRVFDTVLPGSMGAAEADELRDALVGSGRGYLGAGRGAGWVLWFARRRAGLRIDGVVLGSGIGPDAGTGSEAEAIADLDERAILRIRRGALTRTLSAMPLVRAQSVQLRRPAVHRAIGLASIQAHTVLGPVRMELRGLALDDARRVFDLLGGLVVRVQSADRADAAGVSAAAGLAAAAPTAPVEPSRAGGES
ncbi:PH domain-containing protein [Leucobacter weissii]|uniref:PH domain-containing protein n=1 Tax=Leucobacter weissii TaxID=1983706 RepID=A0A939MJF5_9MICO|nr:PH domain-containing protein [Leucobacter weissii]MBO1901666.1 PH domain-containing protein [Leucobacter weissii]